MQGNILGQNEGIKKIKEIEDDIKNEKTELSGLIAGLKDKIDDLQLNLKKQVLLSAYPVRKLLLDE